MILVGPSGCGKSTALNMIAGLEDISSGELRIAGKVVNRVAPRDRDIAMVFQSYALYPHMTVRENMAFALRLKKAPKEEIDRKVGEAADILDLTEHLARQAREPVRRATAACRDGARDRSRPEGVPDGRASVEPRRQAARADARSGRADPAQAQHDHRLRHPRPDRGDDARGPRCGHAQRGAPAGRLADGAVQQPGEPVRSRVHRLPRDELRAGHPHQRVGQSADG